MSGDNNYQPGPDLPMPQSERFDAPIPEQTDQPSKAETTSQRPELTQQNPTQAQPPSIPATPFVPPPLSSNQPSQVPSATPIPVIDAPSSADDSDLIEKEWVNKAKHIVETSRDDPRLQNNQMSKLKADYIQKRYNKQLKVSDE